jgi:hypothetical protein
LGADIFSPCRIFNKIDPALSPMAFHARHHDIQKNYGSEAAQGRHQGFRATM